MTTPQPAALPESATVLPDGSAFAIASFPLPADHWLYAPREYRDGEDDPIELPAPILNHRDHGDAVRVAIRYAVRSATMCGKEEDFDPDALVQNAMYALCGPFGAAALQPAAPLRLDQIDLAPLKAELSEPAKAKAFLQKHGFLNASGELAEQYGGKPAQPAAAGVSDADIASIAQQHWPDATNYGFATHIAFARAILALRPQAVPDAWSWLTEANIDAYLEDYEMRGEDEGGRDACYTPTEGDRALLKDFVMGLLTEAQEAAHHGITAQGEDLWCIHIPGPDEVHAAPSKAAAEHMAARHNQAMDEYLKANPMGEHGPSVESVQAKVIRWPHAAQSHAEEMHIFDWAGWGITAQGAQGGEAK